MGRHVPREAFDHGGSENAHAPTPTLPRRASSRVLPCQEHVKQPSIRDGKTVCRPVDGRSARPRAPPNPLSRCLMNANDAVVGARGPAARSAQSHPPLSLPPSPSRRCPGRRGESHCGGGTCRMRVDCRAPARPDAVHGKATVFCITLQRASVCTFMDVKKQHLHRGAPMVVYDLFILAYIHSVSQRDFNPQ
jgi:hypothetical protein